MAIILISVVLLRVQLHLANSSQYKQELYCLSQGIRSLALLFKQFYHKEFRGNCRVDHGDIYL